MANVALITGAARRVGRAVALRLASAGYDIAFTYLNSRADAEDLERRVRESGREVLAIRCDLAQAEEAARTIRDEFSGKFSRLDVLVNNASIYQRGGLRDVTSDAMHKLFAVHVEAPLLLAREFELMLRQSRGHIVNMADLMSDRPPADYLAYCASKAALGSLTLGLARALAPEVTVNAIAPGVVEWPAEMPEDQRRRYLARVPLARAGTPQDVAEMVLFLATGGGYVTGQIIPLDGGRSIT